MSISLPLDSTGSHGNSPSFHCLLSPPSSVFLFSLTTHLFLFVLVLFFARLLHQYLVSKYLVSKLLFLYCSVRITCNFVHSPQRFSALAANRITWEASERWYPGPTTGQLSQNFRGGSRCGYLSKASQRIFLCSQG